MVKLVSWAVLENKHLFVAWLILVSAILFFLIRSFVERGLSWEIISIIVIILADSAFALIWYWGYKNKNKKS